METRNVDILNFSNWDHEFWTIHKPNWSVIQHHFAKNQLLDRIRSTSRQLGFNHHRSLFSFYYHFSPFAKMDKKNKTLTSKIISHSNRRNDLFARKISTSTYQCPKSRRKSTYCLNEINLYTRKLRLHQK